MAGEAADKAGYYALLDRLPDPPRDMTGVVERAERYAFHFFFRRMIPVAAAVESEGWPPFDIRVERLQDLEPGADPGLDTICAGILERTPFEYPAERLVDQSDGSTTRQR
jgi:hypothetical protein